MRNMLIYSFPGPFKEMCFFPSCKIGSLSLTRLNYKRYACVFYLDIGGEGYSLDSKDNASMTS